MFVAAQKSANALLSKKSISEDDNLIFPSQCLPKTYSISQLQEELVTPEESQPNESELETLLVLNACLREPTRLQREDDQQEHIAQISSWISRSILPDGSIIASDEAPEDDTRVARKAALLKIRHRGLLGLEGLKSLHDLSQDSKSSTPSNQVLLALLAFSSSSDPWTAPSALSKSLNLLSQYSAHLHSPDFITTYLLQTVIRPLFSKSTPSTITSSGRKAMPTSAPVKPHDFGATRSNKPWKYSAPYSVTVLQWAVSNASQETISQSWHLITPPVLTLLDEISTSHRLRGLQILTVFLPKLTAKLLAQTGLGEVFEDAVMPTLLYLPNLTPVEESIQLLPAAYTALFTLSEIRYPPSSSTSPEPSVLPFLTRLFRHGILAGWTYSSTSNYPSIVQILLAQLRITVRKMGIHSTKHLKDIIPMLSSVLMDPFATAKPELLIEALAALKEVLLNAWPRIREEGHRREVIRMLIVCWNSVEREGNDGENAKEIGQVKDGMTDVGRVFVKAIEGKVNIKEELMPLIAIEDSLQDLFGIEVD